MYSSGIGELFICYKCGLEPRGLLLRIDYFGVHVNSACVDGAIIHVKSACVDDAMLASLSSVDPDSWGQGLLPVPGSVVT
jgi:hypothetical protein